MAKKAKKQSEILCDIINNVREQVKTSLETCYDKIEKARKLDGGGVDIEDGPMLPGDDQSSTCVARVFKGQVETDNGYSMNFIKFSEIDTDTLIEILGAMEDVVEEL
ncbi:MAG: hypothetical protein Q8O88_03610 [bacterium]|nr:hypothetical protein [bacterium]